MNDRYLFKSVSGQCAVLAFEDDVAGRFDGVDTRFEKTISVFVGVETVAMIERGAILLMQWVVQSGF